LLDQLKITAAADTVSMNDGRTVRLRIVYNPRGQHSSDRRRSRLLFWRLATLHSKRYSRSHCTQHASCVYDLCCATRELDMEWIESDDCDPVFISLIYQQWLVWRSGNGVRHISEVKLRRARLVLGLVTTFGGSPIPMFIQASRVHSAWPSLRG